MPTAHMATVVVRGLKRKLVCCVVFGCGDFDPPEGGTLQRSGEDAVVVCNKTGETWYVTCRDGFWLGTVGNCTKFGTEILLVVIDVKFLEEANVASSPKFSASASASAS